MNTKLNFLKYATTRIEDNHEFMAYTLKKYREFEKISEAELLLVLDCSINSYYELALCNVPDISDQDFMPRLKVISEYANVDSGKLIPVIKHVNTLLKFANSTGKTLMAARDKEEDKGKDSKE
jgi:hypothetical protein